jgi:hypothetical protein
MVTGGLPDQIDVERIHDRLLIVPGKVFCQY